MADYTDYKLVTVDVDDAGVVQAATVRIYEGDIGDALEDGVSVRRYRRSAKLREWTYEAARRAITVADLVRRLNGELTTDRGRQPIEEQRTR